MAWILVGVAVLLAAGGGAAFWLFRKRRQRSGPLHALVWLLRGQRYLDARILTQAINKALGLKLVHGKEDATDFVVGESPAFVSRIKDHTFLVNNFAVPYFDKPDEVAEEVPELRRRKAVADHKAWLSMDLLMAGEDSPPDAATLREIYGVIGKVIAELADDDCLALFAPEQSFLIPYSQDLLDRLRGPDVIAAIGDTPGVPVVPVGDNAVAMEVAEREARERFPEFVRLFEERSDRQTFAAKGRFEQNGENEFMWLKVTAIEGELIYGILDNDPVHCTRLRAGDRTTIKLDDLNDWVVTEGDTMRGGFTIKVLAPELGKKFK
jgi:uncharacterized protein YegJ (DUF2314 family)